MSEELIKAMDAARVAAEGLARAYRLAMTEAAKSLATMTKTVKAQQLESFQHTDPDGDRVTVRPDPAVGGILYAQIGDEGDGVYLDQDAVNRLAQYLDRHRTDTQCDTQFDAEQCAGMRWHPGDCTPNADDIPSEQETVTDTPIGNAQPCSWRWTNDAPYPNDECELALGHHGEHRKGLMCWLGSESRAYDVSPLCSFCEHIAHGTVQCSVMTHSIEYMNRCKCRGVDGSTL